MSAHVRPLSACRRADTGIVGGKNASLGEMIGGLADKGVRVPPGFATTAAAFRRFVVEADLADRIETELDAYRADPHHLVRAGRSIREAILAASLPDSLKDEIVAAYRALGAEVGQSDPSVAVRSSATAEDLPDASFAGQQETFLNVEGEAALLDTCLRCYASLYTDRAIAYREAKGFGRDAVALSIGVQLMVRSDRGGSGVMFTIDPETGFDRVLVVNAAWGLGETVVQGTVDPDEYAVFKPALASGHRPIVEARVGAKETKMIYGGDRVVTVPTSIAERRARVLDDDALLALARWGAIIEDHYGCPMDIEWARDGRDGRLYIVQARPETVHSQAAAQRFGTTQVSHAGRVLVSGASVGTDAVAARVCLLRSVEDIADFEDGAILVTEATDPDWVPIMKRAAGLVTDHGGRTSHAAIVSRELGLPAIVGTGDATHVLHSGQEVTLSCAGGDVGEVSEGAADIERREVSLDAVPATRTQVMLNLANPAAALRWWRLPADGIGLARMEFVIEHLIGVHPMALARYDRLDDAERAAVDRATGGAEDREGWFVDHLARGLGKLAATVHPRPVIVRMSDFKTNEYATLTGGARFEPDEENPMIGFRGAVRYYSDAYREGFALECRAIAKLRDEMGFDNAVVMIPFCRTVEEADRVLDVMAGHGLRRGEGGLQVFVMCEVPSNVVLAREFARRFDGFSIGSNDLTQLTLGVDRDSAVLAHLFDERDPAVKATIAAAIQGAHAGGAKIGLCGQAPSDHPDFAGFLVGCGIDSISVAPDSFLAVKDIVAEAERERTSKAA